MNLNEQCLLKYLTYPDDIYYSTEFLKINNKILERRYVTKNILANIKFLNYTKDVG